MTANPQRTSLHITGMHCVHCDAAVERVLRALPGVQRVKASFRNGTAEVASEKPLDMTVVAQALAEEGYTASEAPAPQKSGYAEIAGIFLVLAGALFVLNRYDLLPRGFGVSDSMSY